MMHGAGSNNRGDLARFRQVRKAEKVDSALKRRCTLGSSEDAVPPSIWEWRLSGTLHWVSLGWLRRTTAVRRARRGFDP